MQNFQMFSGWSLRFKRQLVTWSIIAATPCCSSFHRFSNVAKPVMFEASIASFVLVLLGCANVFNDMTSKPEPAMSRRESWALRIVLTVVPASSSLMSILSLTAHRPGLGRIGDRATPLGVYG